ncbi:MAG: DNA-packaging protein, partial [Rhodospirillaceae bacterium]|nr:DNA-packaging protein [Rhodospirillaceae bacterium]
TGNPDYHGITVCALGEDQRGYLLEDGSMQGSPHQWATRAIALYDKWDADAIVIEKNQGGDMCRFTLETIRKGVRIIEVHATRGKHVRAEPISALYSLGSISHVGTYPELEDQLCKFTASGYEGEDSPDRAESMIWGFTELFPKLTTEKSEPQPFYGSGQVGSWMG